MFETAVELKVSPSWLNKIQNKTGIGGKTGVRGNRTSISDDDIEIFRNVKLLRDLDFEIEEIKKIYELEKEMISLAGGHESTNLTIYSDNDRCFILHPYKFSVPLFEKIGGSKLTKVESEKYENNAEELKKIFEEEMRRAESKVNVYRNLLKRRGKSKK